MIYRAIIENNISPKKDGRVQVRIFGIHDVIAVIPTEDLPWAEVEQSLSFGFSSGVGFSSIPNIGVWVFVRLDHGNPNLPIITSAISGNSIDKSDFEFPLNDRLNEEDQNRLQRVMDIDGNLVLDETIHKKINLSRDNADEEATEATEEWKDNISGADVTSFEPISLSDKSVYPDNAVIETKSGHIIEIDDTPDNEKIRVFHKSGTYIDYRPEGSIVEKVTANINKIVEGYVQTHIKSGVKTYIENNMDEIVKGYVKRHITSHLDEHINGNQTETIDGGVKTEIKMDNFHHLAGYFKITADGGLEIINDVKITGSLEVSTVITAGSDITSKAEVADKKGNLSSLRDAYDAHFHIGNLGVPTATPTATDPLIRTGDFTWSKSPKGFK